MHTVSFQDVSLAYGDQDILNQLSFTMDENSRTALAGANGSGKTTLMKVLSGDLPPDSGTVEVSKGTRISYVPQIIELEEKHSLYDEVHQAFDRFIPMLERKKEIETKLSSYGPEAPPAQSLIDELDLLYEQLEKSSYYQRDRQIYSVLFGLGFQKHDFSRSCSEFSGGWKMRIALARKLLESPDILLLDEPTNYLDIDARVWLTGFLQRYHGGFMLVSHDKQFLDDTISEVFSLFNGSITRYSGNYSDFERFEKQEQEKLIHAYRQQQQEIQRIEQFIQRFRYKDSKAAQVQSRITYLDKMEKIELPVHMKHISISFPKPSRSGRDVLSLNGICKSYGDIQVIDSFSLFLRRGDRIAVTGRNGAGKSTLMRIIAGTDREFSGERREGTGVHIGYFRQDIDEVLKGEQSVLDEVRSAAPQPLIPSVRDYLGSFLFSGDDVFKPLDVLSGGERSRVQLVKLLLQNYNLLVLDEPTNHLDINAKEVLLQALKEYQGTLVFVSHDQHVIRELAESIIYFSPSGIETFQGGYEYFLWKISGREEEAEAAPRQEKSTPQTREGKKRYQEQKRMRNRLKGLKEEEAQIIADIESSESRMKELHESMAMPEYYQQGEALRQLKQQISEEELHHEKLLSRWHELNEEIAECREELV